MKKAIGESSDEGIDGTIMEDKLGLDIIYIQAKRWKSGNVVGQPELKKNTPIILMKNK
jgi:restriction system protein